MEHYNGTFSLIQPRRGNKRGNPALIHQKFIAEIEAEPDFDQGARYLFERHPKETYFWETTNQNYFRDLDTPSDWKNYA